MEESLVQDTLRTNPLSGKDSTSINQGLRKTGTPVQFNNATVAARVDLSAGGSLIADTATSCARNPVADINFRDSTNIIFTIDKTGINDFPIIISAAGRKQYEKSRSELTAHLRPGEERSKELFQKDLYLPFFLLTILLYGIIRGEILKLFKGLGKLFSFRGTKELASKEGGSIFQWQATIFNFAAFINTSVFLILAAIWFGILPSGAKQPEYFGIAFLIVISGVTMRHFICLAVGNLSEETEVFEEYIYWVYQFYRLASMFLLAISVLILYAPSINPVILFYIGFVIVAAIYFLRVTRLFLIFISRHISILYLILYLCALEILPVGILVKYAGGIL